MIFFLKMALTMFEYTEEGIISYKKAYFNNFRKNYDFLDFVIKKCGR